MWDIIKETFLNVAPFSWKSILTCVICGGVIGFERQFHGKPAGIRTSIMICMSTYIFVALGKNYINPNGDYTRIIGQIVTGVGFLGAGVILSKKGLVLGVTSASIIWLIAALGCMIGVGFHRSSVVFAVLAAVIVFTVGKVERISKHLKKGVHSDSLSDKD